MYVIGIDPGASGGAALLNEDGIVDVVVFSKNTEHDLAMIVSNWKSFSPAMAMLEQVHSMPRQGVASTFKFGQSYGFLRGLLTGLLIPYELVTPQKWQKAMGCMSKGDKNVTKAAAQRLYPDFKVTHATADALLIATFAWRTRER